MELELKEVIRSKLPGAGLRKRAYKRDIRRMSKQGGTARSYIRDSSLQWDESLFLCVRETGWKDKYPGRYLDEKKK